MNPSDNVKETLNTVAAVLLWCFGLGVALLLFWFVMLTLMGDLVYDWHSRFFGISREQFNALHYLMMGFWKAAIFVLFLFPYVGIKLALRKRVGTS